jgi:mevalonate kinase
MSHASAPGKIILFGEHAVVYNRPALAVPVLQVHADARADFVKTGLGTDQRMGADQGWEDLIQVEAPDIRLFSSLSQLLARRSPHPLATAILGTLQAMGVSHPPALKISITSTIPVASGLGSGAAVSVAIIRALSALFNRPLADEQVNELAYEVEKLHHGTPSGIDNTVITYAKPVYFVRGEPIQTFSAAQPFTLVIGDTGISAPTKKSVGDVRKLWEADKNRWEKVFEQVGLIVKTARALIESGKSASISAAEDELGQLMDQNQALLQEMTVSSPELDRLVAAAKAAGALGAKLSGGGRGGNMIALVTPENAGQVAAALLSSGAKKTLTTTVQ